MRRTVKALALAAALLATGTAVSALPTYTYCCSAGCRVVPLSQCAPGDGWTSSSICWSNCKTGPYFPAA
jgi:hypothetical protein